MKSERVERLFDFLWETHRATMSRQKLNEFIGFCLKVLENYFYTHNRSIVQYLQSEGLSAKDIAYECLGGFFRLDKNYRPTAVANFLELLDEPLETINRVKLFIRFTKYLEKMAQRHINFLESVYNPEPARIKREIKFQAKSTGLFTVKYEIFGAVIYPANLEANLHLPLMTPEQFTNFMYGCQSYGASIPSVLKFIHKELIERTDVRRSVMLQFLVDYLRTDRVQLSDIHLNGHFHIQSGVLDFEILQALSFIDAKITEKLLKNYLNKGISVFEAEALKKSCMGVVEDLIKTGRCDQYYEYFEIHHTMTKEDFDKRFRTKMDYLVRISKDVLSEDFLE